MATLVGKGYIFSLSGGVLTRTGIAVVPNLQSLRLSHLVVTDEIKSQAGEIVGLIGSGEALECTFDYVPEGSTIANAKTSAGTPAFMTGVTITSLPVIAMGQFSDALNTDVVTMPWIYMGGGSITGTMDGKWVGTIPLKRFYNITSASAVT